MSDGDGDGARGGSKRTGSRHLGYAPDGRRPSATRKWPALCHSW
ncbi:hypothetical protein FTUN_6384 [Frigoriglobus tundricola]|uniref:Uncharacterized protein n=1 Tax=Frigoriglobus tundricola TaxID=2774151 RepID=A0A6M5YXQ7_9BACT|nr:hypothetical protein FTUN_6384 [Frigoriglobus tundricola]